MFSWSLCCTAEHSKTNLCVKLLQSHLTLCHPMDCTQIKINYKIIVEREIPCHFSVSQHQAGQWWPDHAGDERRSHINSCLGQTTQVSNYPPYHLRPWTLRHPWLSPFPSMPSLAEETRHKDLLEHVFTHWFVHLHTHHWLCTFCVPVPSWHQVHFQGKIKRHPWPHRLGLC